jgi:hypothetical protein
MANLLAIVGRFCGQWVKLAFWGSSWPGVVTKWILIAVGSLVTGLTMTSQIRFSLLTGDNKVVQSGMTWELPIGWLVFGIVAAVLVAVAFGVTWARFQFIEVGEPEWDDDEKVCRLSVGNRGFGHSEIGVYVTAIADDKCVCKEFEPQLPVELEWMNPNRKISRGIPNKVNVFKLGGGHMGGDMSHWSSLVVLCGERGDVDIGFVNAPQAEPAEENVASRLWIEVSIETQGFTRWLSVETGEHFGLVKVKQGIPPFAQKGKLKTVREPSSR